MTRNEQRWALVLAAGSGSRLASLTLDADGRAIPKQYCSLDGEQSLLEATIERAARLVPRERIVVIVANEHERWWRATAAQIPAENWIVQPQNKGTAAGVLLPLLSIYQRDPDARVLVLPSDHHFTNEESLTSTLERAFDRLELAPPLLLIGMAAEGPEPEYGWIVPAEAGNTPLPAQVSLVETFVEKPQGPRLMELYAQGAMWNSFLFLARARGLIGLFARRAPYLLDALRRAFNAGPQELAAFYERLDSRDFSRDLLEHAGRALAVLRAEPCGWTDLGTPRRLAHCIANARAKPASAKAASTRAFNLSLALREREYALAN